MVSPIENEIERTHFEAISVDGSQAKSVFPFPISFAVCPGIWLNTKSSIGFGI